MSDGEKRLDIVRLQEMVQGFWHSGALMAAVELGLFTAVSKGAGSFAEAAAALDITETNAERLMTACVALKLLELGDDGRMTNAPDVERFLVEGSPRYAGPWMLFTKPRWDDWGKLSEKLKSKKVDRLGKYGEFTVERAREYHKATYSIGMGAGRRFARQVDMSGRKRLMDLGGGSGAYSIVATGAYEGLKAVVLDLPAVVVVAREVIAENGASERVAAEACDFTTDPFPTDCDVAVMASNLPIYSREIIADVVKKAFDALLPGGEMHLIGETLDDDRRGPVGPALWGLSEAISGTTGLAHTNADCIGYFENAGFHDVTLNEFVPGSLARITGHKPA
ncbi:MAG: methyltransferase [Rickettsiales bacterium]